MPRPLALFVLLSMIAYSNMSFALLNQIPGGEGADNIDTGAGANCWVDKKIEEDCSPKSAKSAGYIASIHGKVFSDSSNAIQTLSSDEMKKFAEAGAALKSIAAVCKKNLNSSLVKATAPMDISSTASPPISCSPEGIQTIHVNCKSKITEKMNCAEWQQIVDGTKTWAQKINQDIETLSVRSEEARTLSGDLYNVRKKVLMIGGAAAVAGGAAMWYKDKRDDDKREKREKKAREEYENGIITDVEGKKIECFTQENYQRLECRDTLTRLCQTSDKESKSGCMAFNRFYCEGGEGASSNYCLSREAATFCKQQGANVSQSPACTWLNSRPSSCKSDPESLECLYAGTSDALNLTCANFPNDPLCKANAAGRVVTRGGSGSSENTASNTSNTSGTMNDILNGSTTNSSLSENEDLLPPSANLWASSSTPVQQTCQSGALTGCP